ncbi:serine hydrolase, partial [Paenibacillus sp. TAF58]
MRKKGLISLICLQLCLMLLIPAAFAEEKKAAPSVDLTPNAQSAVLMDADTGTVIAEKNKDAKLPPASITKIMTMLLIMEAVDKGNIKMDEKVKV